MTIGVLGFNPCFCTNMGFNKGPWLHWGMCFDVIMASILWWIWKGKDTFYCEKFGWNQAWHAGGMNEIVQHLIPFANFHFWSCGNKHLRTSAFKHHSTLTQTHCCM